MRKFLGKQVAHFSGEHPTAGAATLDLQTGQSNAFFDPLLNPEAI